MQNIPPKIKDYSLSIKITEKKTIKSFLCVTDFNVSLPNFICREPFNTETENINLLDHSALHLDHKCL